MLFPVCGCVATRVNYLVANILQVAVEAVSCSSRNSCWGKYGRCLQGLFHYGNSSCMHHCLVAAGSRCPAVSLHVNIFATTLHDLLWLVTLYTSNIVMKGILRYHKLSFFNLTLSIKMSEPRTLTK